LKMRQITCLPLSRAKMLRLNSLARIWSKARQILDEAQVSKRSLTYHWCPGKINAILRNGLSKCKLSRASELLPNKIV
jgi:hypothetical protein